jgi:Tfp pilus assembly protein PilF
LLWPALLIGLALWLYWHDPERLYTNAWVKMRSSQHIQAAQLFDEAYAGRRSDAKQEEALFWAAKAYEQAGLRDEALARYVRLTSSFHGYWLPEALYLQWQLARAKGLAAQADAARERLLREFPVNRWAQRVQ